MSRIERGSVRAARALLCGFALFAYSASQPADAAAEGNFPTEMLTSAPADAAPERLSARRQPGTPATVARTPQMGYATRLPTGPAVRSAADRPAKPLPVAPVRLPQPPVQSALTRATQAQQVQYIEMPVELPTDNAIAQEPMRLEVSEDVSPSFSTSPTRPAVQSPKVIRSRNVRQPGAPEVPEQTDELPAPTRTAPVNPMGDLRMPEDDCPPSKIKNLSEIRLTLDTKDGILPRECPAPEDGPLVRCHAPLTYSWKASALCHKPLYFEEVQLERYGHVQFPILQPAISGAKFIVGIPLLPYKMGLEPPDECVYVLGYYRPGNCAPYLRERIPLQLDAITLQTAAVAGLILLIP